MIYRVVLKVSCKIPRKTQHGFTHQVNVALGEGVITCCLAGDTVQCVIHFIPPSGR